MNAGLVEFFRYNLWANRCLLEACAQLSDAQLDATVNGTYGSVRETLVHVFSGEEGYVWHCTGNEPTPPLEESDPFPGFAVLRERAELSGNALIAFVEQGDVNRVLSLDEGKYEIPLINVLIQAINHAVDHRSQIATLLSQQGVTLPDLDGWAYNDAQRANG